MPDPYEIAAWRFEQIAPLLDASLDATQRRVALRERTRQPVAWPQGGRHRPIPKSTLYRWLKAYREHGYPGLLPKVRADRGAPRRAGTAAWIGYAIGLLYEQPSRSLTQIETYLRLQFADYRLSRSSLARHLRAHPAFNGIEKLRRGHKSKLRALYEAQHPHEGWQLDGKGPFPVRLQQEGRVQVHVLSVLDDHSRYALAARVAGSESEAAAIGVFEQAVGKWGLADRFQFDGGSAFDAKGFRQGLAQLGVHRNALKVRTPEWQGKIEAYHRSLVRWFVNELPCQEVVDRVHLQQLLEAMLALLYNRHRHRELGTTPEKRLADRRSPRQVSLDVLRRAFFLEITAKAHPKTGEVRLPNGALRVPAPFAGQRNRFAYHPVHPALAVLITTDGREIALAPFTKQPLSAVAPQTPKRGTGQLQKLLDLWHGHERPNAQPGFGLPEVFAELAALLGRAVPESEREARTLLGFYRKYGPLPREPFLKACARTAQSLGTGRPLAAYLADLERQISAHHEPPVNPDSQEGMDP
jgi:putative transposase